MSEPKSQRFVHFLMHVLMWIGWVLVSLSVAFGMIDGILSVRFLPISMTAVVGWVILVLTIVTVLLAFFDKKR